ncbi:MAG: hypothetical protein HY543_03630 [Deltaproteobacteria bacterium]|nr:hypothetical protein [Deltaproteobacteria bacterium]
MKKQMLGAVVATAVAGLMMAGVMKAQAGETAKDAKVKCTGINGCQGKGECKSDSNGCAGHNGCKAKGWVHVSTEKECTDKGGKVVK